MKAVNIKWDTDKNMEALDKLPTEIEIPDNLLKGYDGTNFDTYYSDISDWLSDEFGFCHFGFELAN